LFSRTGKRTYCSDLLLARLGGQLLDRQPLSTEVALDRVAVFEISGSPSSTGRRRGTLKLSR
jgi:hypothetical protein